MTRAQLVWRSLVHYRRTNLAVVLGTAVGTAVLVGSLGVGDSVRHSLQWLVDARLGRTEVVLSGGERFLRSDLAAELATASGVDTAPVLLFEGVAASGGGRARANRVQVVGVDERFWSLGGVADPLTGSEGDVAAVNSHLAQRLGVVAGDEILIRLQRADRIPGDVAFVSRSRTTRSLSLVVREVLDDSRLGRFGLRAHQVAPLSVFLSLDELGGAMALANRANLVLIAGRGGEPPAVADLRTHLRSVFSLADAGLRIREVPDQGSVELLSERVFLDPVVETAALRARAGARPLLTYLVNSISTASRSTPYSFVAAPGAPLVPPQMSDDEIVVNQWLAADLEIDVGHEVQLSYLVPDAGSGLAELSATFRVREVVAVEGAAADRSLMPEIPGLAGAEDCRRWDTGIPVDLDLVRDRDEAYWDEHGGTPKAFVTLAAAQNMWKNRFGDVTAVRFPTAGSAGLEEEILAELEPEALGLRFSPVREHGRRAGNEAVDFAQLFIGLGFFLIVAALLLTGLLFALGVEQRSQETGILRALGFTPREAKRLMLAEGAVLAVAGTAVGLLGGFLFVHGVLHALSTVWQGVVGSTVLVAHVAPASLAIGGFAGAVMALLAMAAAQRSSQRRSIRELISSTTRAGWGAKQPSGTRSFTLSAVSCLAAAAIIFGVGPGAGREATGAFWGAGALMLLSCLAASHGVLARRDRCRGDGPPTVHGLGLAEAARRRRRSVVTIALIAVAVFIVVAVAANRRSALANADQRSSGTGGFAFFGETTLPVADDLDDPAVRGRLGLPGDSDLSFVQLRRRSGDDASCLNLNRVSRPTILGVDPAELAGRGAFTFVKLADGIDGSSPWTALDEKGAEGEIPAVADQTVITWGLGLSVGDVLTLDDDRGREVRLKLVGGLANSVFQGNLLISEHHFKALFPSESGTSVMLVDAPSARRTALGEALKTAFQDHGLEIVTTTQRLEAFNVVENSYLSIFLAFGGLALILGTAGVAVIVLRDVLERRGELAILRAVGFPRQALEKMLTAEYGALVAAGVASGALSAAVAVLPAVLAPGAEIPWAFLLTVLALITASAALWVATAARLATRGDPIAALREE